MRIKTAKVLENKLLSEDTFLLKLAVGKLKKLYPTQFILVDTYPYRFLLKPFSVVEYKNNTLTLLYRVISDGTKFLSTLNRNSTLTFLGPFGNYKKITQLRIKNGDYIILIAGGSGVASIISLYKYFINFTDNIEVFYGERSKNYIVNLKFFNIKNVTYATEDGSYGNKGTILDVFINKQLKQIPDYIFICGPKTMLRTFKEVNNNFCKTKVFALLEEYMCCGIGLCRSCIVKIKDNEKITTVTVCKDGPMFELKTILF